MDMPLPLPQELRDQCALLRPADAALVAERFAARRGPFLYQQELYAGRLPPPMHGPRDPTPPGPDRDYLIEQVARVTDLLSALPSDATGERGALESRLADLQTGLALASLPGDWISGVVPGRSVVREEIHASAMALALSGATPSRIIHHLVDAVGISRNNSLRMLICIKAVFRLRFGDVKAMTGEWSYGCKGGKSEAEFDERWRPAWAAAVIDGPQEDVRHFISCAPEWQVRLALFGPVCHEDEE